jgi:hypothetical protein
MEPLFQTLAVALTPQLRQMPPAPFEREALQRVYFDVNRIRPYSQFVFLPGDSGAQMMNGPHDRVVVTPQLVQLFVAVDSTIGRARELAMDILKTVAERLRLDTFLQLGVNVTAHVPSPGDRPDARGFVKEQILKGSPDPEELGAGFYAGGVKFRRFDDTSSREENLSIEPLVTDHTHLWVNYNIQLAEPIVDLQLVADRIDEAFSFVSGPAMSILEA